MEKYDYRRAMIEDIKEYIVKNLNKVELDPLYEDDNIEDILYDILITEETVTGNGPNYYDIEERCYDYLKGNLNLYFEAAYEFDDYPNADSKWTSSNPAQHMDCVIRCYLLDECLNEALSELNVVR